MIHARQVERYGGAHGGLDENVVLSALARPRRRWAYDEPGLADLAAAHLVGFALVMQAANNGADDDGVAAWFRSRMARG